MLPIERRLACPGTAAEDDQLERVALFEYYRCYMEMKTRVSS